MTDPLHTGTPTSPRKTASCRSAFTGDGRATASDEPAPDLQARYVALLEECEALRAAKVPQANVQQDQEIAVLRQRIVEVADSLLRQNRLPSVDVFPMPGAQAGPVPLKQAERV